MSFVVYTTGLAYEHRSDFTRKVVYYSKSVLIYFLRNINVGRMALRFEHYDPNFTIEQMETLREVGGVHVFHREFFDHRVMVQPSVLLDCAHIYSRMCVNNQIVTFLGGASSHSENPSDRLQPMVLPPNIKSIYLPVYKPPPSSERLLVYFRGGEVTTFLDLLCENGSIPRDADDYTFLKMMGYPDS